MAQITQTVLDQSDHRIHLRGHEIFEGNFTGHEIYFLAGSEINFEFFLGGSELNFKNLSKKFPQSTRFSIFLRNNFEILGGLKSILNFFLGGGGSEINYPSSKRFHLHHYVDMFA